MNTQQQAAATCEPGYVQVIAGPGTGKTKTLTARLEHFVSSGIDPQKIVLMTFTRQAAGEIRNRVGLNAQQLPYCGTFHGIAVRLLKNSGCKFQVADEDDKKDILRSMSQDYECFSDDIGSLISYHKSRNEIPQGTDLLPIFEQYNAELKRRHLLDFDDLLLEINSYLHQKKSVWLESFVASVQAVLIDEFQDTSSVQLDTALALAAKCDNLTIVGDPDQSIYSFRNAEPRNFGTMAESKTVTTFYLEQNYRSTSSILKLAQKVIERSKERYGDDRQLVSTQKREIPLIFARIDDTSATCRQISDKIREMVRAGIEPKEIAVLCRSSLHFHIIDTMLTSHGIKTRVFGGRRTKTHAEVKHFINYMRVIASDTDDLAIKRTINVPRRGIGLQALAVIFPDLATLPAVLLVRCKQTHALREYHATIMKARSLYDRTVSGLIECARFVVSVLDSILNEAQKLRLGLLVDSIADADLDEEDVLAQFVQRWQLDSVHQSDDGNFVSLSTIHSAKGLEWPVVFMPFCDSSTRWESLSTREKDEEIRILFVGITRAAAYLTVIFSSPHPGLPTPNEVSRNRLPRLNLELLGSILRRELLQRRDNKVDYPGFQWVNEMHPSPDKKLLKRLHSSSSRLPSKRFAQSAVTKWFPKAE